MKLNELLRHIDLDTLIWVSTDETSDEGIYFGEAGSITCGIMRKCTVRKYYAEYYKARYRCGISIIVDIEE